jgi:hypothetical protein
MDDISRLRALTPLYFSFLFISEIIMSYHLSYLHEFLISYILEDKMFPRHTFRICQITSMDAELLLDHNVVRTT